MTEKAIDWVDLAAKAGTELKGLIREAHEAARDLKTEIQIVRDQRAKIQRVADSLDASITEAIREVSRILTDDFARHKEVMAEIGAEIGAEMGFDLLLRLREVLDGQQEKWVKAYDAAGVNQTMPKFVRDELSDPGINRTD